MGSAEHTLIWLRVTVRLCTKLELCPFPSNTLAGPGPWQSQAANRGTLQWQRSKHAPKSCDRATSAWCA